MTLQATGRGTTLATVLITRALRRCRHCQHRFCIAVRLLCVLHVLRIVRFALARDGNTSTSTLFRSTGWWLRPVISTCYPARFIPRAHWNWSNLKTQIDCVLFACSLDLKMKERAGAAHRTNTPWFMSSKETSKPSAKRGHRRPKMNHGNSII